MTDPNLTPQIPGKILAEIPQVRATQSSAQAGMAADAVVATMSGQDADHGNQIRELSHDQTYAANSAPVPATGSGGYGLTPAEIHQQYQQCTSLLARFRKKYVNEATLIANVKPPAPDIVGSVPQATAVAALGERAVTRVMNQIAFLTSWQAKLQQAKENYLEQEHLTQAQWDRLMQQEQR